MEQKEKQKKAPLTRIEKEKSAAQKIARANKITSIVIAVLSVVIIAGLLIFIPLFRKRADLKEHFRINNESVSKLEFNYYKNRILNNFITTYGGYLSLFGLDVSQDLSTQIFDSTTGMTWMDYFEEQAVSSITESRALIADMKAKGETVDISANFDAYKKDLSETAASENMSVKDYLVKLYGEAATESRIMNFIQNELTASAYYSALMEKFTVSDDAVQEEIDANIIKYTSVDYRILTFYTGLSEDASESEIAAALQNAEQRANEMLDKVVAGGDFEDLCIDYADESLRTEYADPDTDKSLETVTDLTPDETYAGFSTWLFDENRKENDTTIYTDTEKNVVYLLKFEKRYLADATKEYVKETLTSKEVNSYLDNLTSTYILSDTKNNLTYLQKKNVAGTAN